MEVVHVGYGHVTASNEVVAVARDKNGLVDTDVVGGAVGLWGDKLGHENRCHGTQENGVATEESKKLCG